MNLGMFGFQKQILLEGFRFAFLEQYFVQSYCKPNFVVFTTFCFRDNCAGIGTLGDTILLLTLLFCGTRAIA